MTSVANSIINPVVGPTQHKDMSFAYQCRSRNGYHDEANYTMITCAMCFIYVFENTGKFTYDPRSTQLSCGTNSGCKETTLIKADINSQESISALCGSLKDPSECWKWQDCCREASRCCQEQMDNSVKNSKGTRGMHCPHTWDGYSCWPDTPAGQRPQLLCPAHVPSAVSGRYAYKTCTENATWYLAPNTSSEWTDYTDCTRNEHYRKVHTVGLVCSTITLVLLIPACAIFLCYKPLRQQHRIRIHLCLMVSSFVTALCMLIWELTIFKELLDATSRVNHTSLKKLICCRILMMVIRYAEISSFMWMFIEGFHLHRLLVHAFSVPKTLIPYYVFGFGFPTVPVIVYAVIRATDVKLNQKCWTDHGGNYELIFTVPSLAALAINVLFLMRIVFIMVRQLETHPNEPSNFRRAIKAVVVLMPLFGVQTLLFAYNPSPDGDLHKIYSLVNKMCMSLQGSFVVLVFCYCNKEVQAQLKTSIMRLLKRGGGQDASSRCYTMSTQFISDSSRGKMSNGTGESGHLIPLRPIIQHNINDQDKTRKRNDAYVNGESNLLAENVDEGLLMGPAKCF